MQLKFFVYVSIFSSLHYYISIFNHKSLYLDYVTAILYMPVSLKQVKLKNITFFGQQNVHVLNHVYIPI